MLNAKVQVELRAPLRAAAGIERRDGKVYPMSELCTPEGAEASLWSLRTW